MRERNRLTRRRWLAACGGAAATSLAGCLGGDSSTDGAEGNSDGSDGGSTGDDTSGDSSDRLSQEDIQGQLQTDETVSDRTEWEYDLEAGDTLTATFDGDEYGKGRIYRGDSLAIEDVAKFSSDDELAITQVTAEESQMYRVVVQTDSPVDVKVYVDSA